MAKRSVPHSVRKRDGSIVPFNKEKIRHAIERAAFEVLQDKTRSAAIAASVTEGVVQVLAARTRERSPSVETIQDMIEKALMDEEYTEISKAYILYRQKRTDIRVAKSALGHKDDLKLPLNAMEVLKTRYLLG
jgi:ribonucleoside-diphosphate reductase alpha chain